MHLCSLRPFFLRVFVVLVRSCRFFCIRSRCSTMLLVRPSRWSPYGWIVLPGAFCRRTHMSDVRSGNILLSHYAKRTGRTRSHRIIFCIAGMLWVLQSGTSPPGSTVVGKGWETKSLSDFLSVSLAGSLAFCMFLCLFSSCVWLPVSLFARDRNR